LVTNDVIRYGGNLGNDATKLTFKPADLAGCAQSYIDDRTDASTGEVVVTLKYPDLLHGALLSLAANPP
jgi:hypothetical protein